MDRVLFVRKTSYSESCLLCYGLIILVFVSNTHMRRKKPAAQRVARVLRPPPAWPFDTRCRRARRHSRRCQPTGAPTRIRPRRRTCLLVTRSKPELTPTGQSLAPVLTAALDQIDNAVRAVLAEEEAFFRLRGLSTLAMLWLIPRLHRFTTGPSGQRRAPQHRQRTHRP